MKEAGLSVPAEYVKVAASTELDGFTREAGYQTMKEFLAMGNQMPTALFVSSDIQAAGALQALTEGGKSCPDDIAIVSFDDIELASHLGLTTMRQPMHAMGELAVDMLFQRIKDPQAPVQHKKFKPELVIRKTCGAVLGEKASKVEAGVRSV